MIRWKCRKCGHDNERKPPQHDASIAIVYCKKCGAMEVVGR